MSEAFDFDGDTPQLDQLSKPVPGEGCFKFAFAFQYAGEHVCGGISSSELAHDGPNGA